MRLSDYTRSQNMLKNLNDHRAILDRLETEVATGRRVVSVSDDPESYSMLMRLKDESSLNEGYVKNIDNIESELQLYETVVDDITSSLRSITVQISSGMNDGSYTERRQSIIQSIDNTLEKLVVSGNSKIGGKYLFSGSKTLTKPFDVTRGANGISGITYNGDTLPKEYNPNTTEKMTVNLSGQEVFMGRAGMGENIFDNLIQLKQDLTEEEFVNAEEHYENFNHMLTRVIDKRGEIGSELQHLDGLKGFMENYDYYLTEKSAEIEFVDLAESITKLLNQENVYRGALEVAGRFNNLSILDYVK